MRLATYASTSVAVVLLVAKVAVWVVSDSVSLLATLIDSGLDLLASLINLVAVRHALSPADKEHRFGHGKAEALAGLGQAMFIAGSAGFLLLESTRRLFDPVQPQAVGWGMAVMVFSIVVTLLLVAFQSYVVRKSGSTAIRADALHYKTDILVNASVILALWLASTGWPGFDALFAVLIALYILYSAWEIVRQSYDHLMDKELPDDEREAILKIICANRDALGVHDLRTRRSGTVTFIQFHLELEDSISLMRAHKIADAVEQSLLQHYPNAEIIIHEDPQSVAIKEDQPDFDELSPTEDNLDSRLPD